MTASLFTRLYALEIEAGVRCCFDHTNPSNQRHLHHAYEICLVTQGRGLYLTPDRSFTLGSWDLFVAEPGMVHELRAIDHESLEVVFVTVKVTKIPSPLPPPAGLVTSEEDAVIERFVTGTVLCKKAMVHLASHSALFDHILGASMGWVSQQYLRVLTLEWMACLAQQTDLAPSHEALPSALDSAIRFVHQHDRDKISIPIVASAAGVSVRVLQRLFRTHLNCTIVDHINRRRMAVAATLLLTGLRCQEVAEALQIDDPGQFSRLFKRHFGVSPGTYARSQGPKEMKFGASFTPGP